MVPSRSPTACDAPSHTLPEPYTKVIRLKTTLLREQQRCDEKRCIENIWIIAPWPVSCEQFPNQDNHYLSLLAIVWNCHRTQHV